MSFNTDVTTIGAGAVSGTETGTPGEIKALTVSASENLFGRKVRCPHEQCKKKLNLVDKSIKCICQKSFCPKHRLPESHSCGDLKEYAERQRLQLKEQHMGGIHKSNSFSDYSSSSHPGDYAF